MRKILIILGLILCGSALFGQSPRIRLNQITKDSLTGSVVLSGSDSNMVYSRDFFLNLTDSVLILFGDTLSTTATAFSGVQTDLTLTGNGTVGNELKVDTAVIATVSALADSLAGIISSVTTDLTLTGDGSIATPLKVDTSVIATIRALADSVATRGTVTSVAVAAGTGISVSGSPITTSGTITVTNTAPDQTVSITGAGINAVTGTYPNFTITGTEVDGSITNELQTISTTGAAGNITLSNGGGTLNLNVNDADASATNEGSLTVGAGGANSSDIVSNTSGSTNVTIAGGSNVTVTESGSTITIASTAGGTGTVTDITAGTFLSGGTITTSGTIALDTASAGLKTYISENIGTVDLASEVTGTLPVANGGTGATTLTSGAFLKGNGTSAVSGSSNLTETADTVYVAKYLDVDTSTLYVDAINNRVGIGTTAPTAKLDVNGSFKVDNGGVFYDNTTKTLNVNADPDANYNLNIKNSASVYAQMQLRSDDANGSSTIRTRSNDTGTFRSVDVKTDNTGLTGFVDNTNKFIRGETGQILTNNLDLLILAYNSGKRLGFGTDANTRMIIQSNGDLQLFPETSGTASGNAISWNSVDSTIYFSTSSIRFKENIRDYDKGISTIMQMKPVYFNYLTSSQLEAGFIAEDIESIGLNEYTTKDSLGLIYGLRVGAFKPLIVKAIQEQQVIIQTQQQEIEKLKTQIQNILTEINNLKNN